MDQNYNFQLKASDYNKSSVINRDYLFDLIPPSQAAISYSITLNSIYSVNNTVEKILNNIYSINNI